MKRLAVVLFFACACSTKSTAPPAPAPTASSAPSAASASSASASASGSASASASTASAARTCSTDADCSKLSSYCGDLPCACIPYLTSAGAPKCNQPNAVKCLVDPCQRKTAACQEGKCVITAGATR